MGKQIPTVHVLHSRWGSSGTHTLTCETWYSLLLVIGPAPEDLPAQTHSTRVVHRYPTASHWIGMTAQRQPKGSAFALRVCGCAHVCVKLVVHQLSVNKQKSILLATFFAVSLYIIINQLIGQLIIQKTLMTLFSQNKTKKNDNFAKYVWKFGKYKHWIRCRYQLFSIG